MTGRGFPNSGPRPPSATAAPSGQSARVLGACAPGAAPGRLRYAGLMELPELARPLPEPPVPGEPPSVVELVRRGTIDAELAAILWLLLEGRIPVVVAAPAELVAD